MALWPFGRRRKRGRKPAEDETSGTSPQQQQQQDQQQSLTRPHTPPAQTTADSYIPIHGSNVFSGMATRRDSKRRKRDSTQTNNDNEASTFPHSSIPSAPSSLPAQFSHPNSYFLSGEPGLRPQASVDTFLSHNFSTAKSRLPSEMSQSNFAGSLHHVPTLRGKRHTTDSKMNRRKSDRRKRHDPAREQEIKDMINNSWDPRRNLADANKSSNKHLSDPVNSYSAPTRPSFEPCDSQAYKVNAFDALTPRPFIRYTESPRSIAPQTSDFSRSPTAKGKERRTTADKSTGTNRIEHLADDMDAGALRALMERDSRRKLTKSRESKDKTPRKHSKRADMPQERGSPKAKTQYGVGNTLADRQSDKREISQSPTYSASWLRDPSRESLSNTKKEPAARTSKAGPQDDESDNVPPTHLHIDDEAMSEPTNAPPGSSIVDSNRASLCVSPLPVIPQGSTSDVSRNLEGKTQDNNGKLNRSWTSFFRRRTLRRKMSGPQKKHSSEFSVTSRESAPKNQSHSMSIPGAIHRSVTADNQSTRSKFTEHLDDSPMAHGTRLYPADSSSAIRDDAYSYSNRMSVGTGNNAAERQSMSAVSAAATGDQREGRRSSGANSPDTRPNSLFLAQSLASIDSEASWLSGKPSRRLSQTPLNHLQKSAGSTRERLDDTVESGEEEEHAMGEEYFGTLPVPEEEDEDAESGTPNSKDGVINNIMGPETNGHDEVEATTWHGSVGKRPLLVKPNSRAKSNEGLFTEFLESESEMAPVEHEATTVEEDESQIGRATSVDLVRGHVRQISAGSARLLDLGH